MGLVSYWQKKATLQSKHFHFCRQKHVNEKCQRLNLLKGSDFFPGWGKALPHLFVWFSFVFPGNNGFTGLPSNSSVGDIEVVWEKICKAAKSTRECKCLCNIFMILGCTLALFVVSSILKYSRRKKRVFQDSFPIQSR